MIYLPDTYLASLDIARNEQMVAADAISFNYKSGDLVEGAFKIAHLLLYRANNKFAKSTVLENKYNTPYEKLIDFQKNIKPYYSHILSNWLTAFRSDLTYYTGYLYNKNYKNTRRLLNKYLYLENSPPPYQFLLTANAIHKVLGVSHTELSNLPLHFSSEFKTTAKYIKQLYEGPDLDHWLNTKTQSLRYYGGSPNTTLGLYDNFFTNSETGFDQFNLDADVKYDLGGGFATSEICKATGHKFVSADIVSSSYIDFDDDICLMTYDPLTNRKTFANQTLRDDFFARQNKVQYEKFNVLDDSFHLDADSYAITSAGFMTSTVRPHIKDTMDNSFSRKSTHTSLSIHAIIRIIELVKAGKTVDLFTIQRASSKIYKYKTVLLQWREGKLITIRTTDDPIERWNTNSINKIYTRINPELSDYNSLE